MLSRTEVPALNRLAAHFAVTACTIRHDVEPLEAMDLLQRIHDGAIASSSSRHRTTSR